MDTTPFDFEITGAAKIQQVVKEHRNATLSFKDACRIWTQHSEDRYCAGWIDMDVFKDDLNKEILEAYDTYAIVPASAKVSLKDKLKEWTDVDVTEYELAIAIGLMNENVPFPTDAKHIFWTNNPIGNMLYDMLKAMKENGILEENIDQQFRWNSTFKGSWEKTKMKEPKDQFSDEWYEWRKQEDERQYHSQKLQKSQSHGDMGPPDTKAYDKCKEAELIGSTITNIGFSPAVGEGGFGIDYVTKDGVKKRILFGYTELGLWVEWSGNV